jgi:hypothetical protein
VEVFRLESTKLEGLEKDLDTGTKSWLTLTDVKLKDFIGTWNNKKEGTYIFNEDGKGQFIHKNGKSKKALTYAMEGHSLIASLEGETFQRQFYKRQRKNMIYELIKYDDRKMSRRNNYIKK